MTIEWDEIAAGALESIEEAGQPVTLHIPGTAVGGYVPGVGVEEDWPARDVTGIGALFGYKQTHIDGTNILHGDQRLLLAPQIEVEPVTGNTMTVGGVRYNVVRCERVAPAGIPVLYKVQLRGV